MVGRVWSVYRKGFGLPDSSHEEGQLGFIVEEGLEDSGNGKGPEGVLDIGADKGI